MRLRERVATDLHIIRRVQVAGVFLGAVTALLIFAALVRRAGLQAYF